MLVVLQCGLGKGDAFLIGMPSLFLYVKIRRQGKVGFRPVRQLFDAVLKASFLLELQLCGEALDA